MAKGHWLDPLARLLLTAGGLKSRPSKARSQLHDVPDPQERVELDLLAMKLSQNPGLRLRDGAEVRRAAALGWRLDVNRASGADWQRLPGCTPVQIDLLMRLQAGGIQLSGCDDLQEVLNLDNETIRCWKPLLLFRWYGSPPENQTPATVPVNRADPRQLEERLGLSPDRLKRLVRERARSPFVDLADLQARLQIPPLLAESWIGRISFDRGPAGPVLPPGVHRR